MTPALERVVSRIDRAAKYADEGSDVEQYLDGVAVDAFVALYPAEVPDLAEAYGRGGRRRMSEHLLDALVMAVMDADERELATGGGT